MRVKWTGQLTAAEEDMDNWSGGPLPLPKYEGEVIGTVRAWGTTMLVVMLDSGTVTEVRANWVERCP
jgi:hypothetical protein